jgi:transcriptional regulator NrdR family protein
MKKIYVIKADGYRVLFDPNKVIRTCIRAGASRKEAKRIAKNTLNMIHSDFTTREDMFCGEILCGPSVDFIGLESGTRD